MNKILCCLSSAVLSVLSGATAWAQEEATNEAADFTPYNYYIAMIGKTSVKSDIGVQDFSHVAVGFGLGYQSSPIVGFEGNLFVSIKDERDDTLSSLLGQKVSAGYASIGAFVTARNPGDFYVKGKLGLAWSRFSYSADDYEDEDESKIGMAYGFGAGLVAGDSLFEIEFTQLPEVDDPIFSDEKYDPSIVAFNWVFRY